MPEIRNPNTPVGILIDQLKIEIEAARGQGRKLWAERLTLHVRPQPWWIPDPMWRWMCNLVLKQGHELRSSIMNPTDQGGNIDPAHAKLIGVPSGLVDPSGKPYV